MQHSTANALLADGGGTLAQSVVTLIGCRHGLNADSQPDQSAADILLSATAVRPPGTWRYNVEELHPICRATSEAVMVPDASIAFAALGQFEVELLRGRTAVAGGQ
jgi:hypothetical protein